MLVSLWSLQDILTPWQAAAATGRLSSQDRPVCPYCEIEVIYTDRWFQCPNCRKAGDALRYLVYVEATRDQVSTMLSDHVTARFTESEVDEVIAFSEKLVKFDNLVERLFSESVNASVTPITANAHAFLRKLGVNKSVQLKSVAVLSSEQISVLCEHGQMTYPQASWPQVKHPQIVIPFWACPGVLHSIQMIDARPRGVGRVVEFNAAYRIGFSGIGDLIINGDSVYLAESSMSALTRNSHYAQFERHKFAVAARKNSTTSVRSLAWIPGSIVVDDPGDLLASFIDVMLQINSNAVDVLIEEDSEKKPFIHWLQQTILSMLLNTQDTRTLTSDMSARIRACRFPIHVTKWLISELYSKKKYGLAEAVNRLENNRLVCETGSGQIRAADGCYALEKSNGERTPITNFVVRLNNVAVFADAAAMSVNADIDCVGGVGSVSIPVDALHSCPVFEKLVGPLKLTPPAGRIVTPEFPAVYHRKHMQTLLMHLLTEIPALPRVEGISRFGWNNDNTGFYTGFGLVNSKGVDGDVLDVYDKCALRGVMRPCSVADSDTSPVYPSDSWINLFSMMISTVCRGFWKLPPRVVKIDHDPSTASVLEKFFATIGQTRVITMNTRSDDFTRDQIVAASSGYPLLIVNSAPGEYSKIPGHIVLSTGGAYKLTLEDAGDLSKVWAYIVKKVIQGLTNGTVSATLLTAGVDNTVSAIREGREIISAAVGWDLSELPDLTTPMDTWLSKIPCDRIKDYVSLHLIEQVVEFDLSDQPEVARNSIREFAASRTTNYALTERGFRIDAIAAMAILTDFYMVMPSLNQVTNDAALHTILNQPARQTDTPHAG